MSWVVDTNVLAVADERAGQAGWECVSACRSALIAAVTEGVTLDSKRLILKEYERNVLDKQLPGWAFVLSLHRNYATERVELVDVHQHAERGFEEFPDDPALAGFHHKDRKFVAVAIASRFDPPILNASDTDWWSVREHLARHGVRVQFLCEELMR